MKKTVLTLLLATMADLARGDIISGTVTDACENTPMAGVRVSASGRSVFSAADGTYRLDTEATPLRRHGKYLPDMYWDAGAGAFRWDPAHGTVEAEVRNLRGDRVQKQAVEGASFAFNPREDGIHFILLRTSAGETRFRAITVSGRTRLLGGDEAGDSPSARKTLAKEAAAAAVTVSYEFQNYTAATREVTGSQSGVNVQLSTVAAPVMGNGMVELTFTKATGAITARNIPANLAFIKSAALSQTGGCAKYLINQSESNFTGGQAIEVLFSNGNRDRILLFPNRAFAYFKKNYRNNGASDQTTAQVNQLTATLGANVAVGSLRAQGTAGLTAVTGHPGSYAYLAIANPANRNGVVAGWVTNYKGIGIVTSGASGNDATITARLEFGKMRLRPNTGKEGDLFAVGYFDDARLGLEAHADDIAVGHRITMKPNRVVYCTWYAGVGGEGNQSQMTATSQWLNNNLVDFGFSDAQIDDGWQVNRRKFDDYNRNGSYPSGMLNISNVIKNNRMRSGLWYMPTAGDAPISTSWYLKDANGGYEQSSWAGYNLDPTLQAVKDYIRTCTNNIGNTWGFNYFKVDGMFTGMGAHQNYINDGYKTDDFFFNAAFSDPYVTNVEAYRDAWQIIRTTAPANTFIMGCTISQNMRTMSGSYGIMDALRIGPDNGPEWTDRLMRGIDRGGQRYFYNGRVWWNDPDPIYVRIPVAEARTVTSFNAISGFLYTASEVFENLSADAVNIFKRTIPHHGSLNVRPSDYFERANPRVWLLTGDPSANSPRRDVVGVFNWDASAAFVETHSLAKMGLSGTAQYVGFDFWANTFVNPFSGNLSIALPARNCRVLALRQVSGNPMVLSTNRHVSSGIYDVISETWNAGTRTLSGTSRVVRNDPYELRIWAANASGGSWTAASATASGGVGTPTLTQSGNQLRVRFTSTSNQNVNWSIVFN